MSQCVQEPALTEDKQIQELISKAKAAQAKFESFSQEQVDAIVKGIGKYVYDNAEPLARMAVDESGIGVYEDKVLKNKSKARVIWNNLKDKKSRGVIGEGSFKRPCHRPSGCSSTPGAISVPGCPVQPLVKFYQKPLTASTKLFWTIRILGLPDQVVFCTIHVRCALWSL